MAIKYSFIKRKLKIYYKPLGRKINIVINPNYCKFYHLHYPFYKLHYSKQSISICCNLIYLLIHEWVLDVPINTIGSVKDAKIFVKSNLHYIQMDFAKDIQLSFQIQVQFNILLDLDTLKWSMINDQSNVDTPTIINGYKRLPNYIRGTFLIGLQIVIFTFNDIPINSGIQFKIMEIFILIQIYKPIKKNCIYLVIQFRQIYVSYNNTYYGSIVFGIQTDKVKLSKIQIYGSFSTYSTSTSQELITFVDIAKNEFLFSVIGNYTQILIYSDQHWHSKLGNLEGHYNQEDIVLNIAYSVMQRKRSILFYYIIQMQNLSKWIPKLSRCHYSCTTMYRSISEIKWLLLL